jgi:hypothetical protein
MSGSSPLQARTNAAAIALPPEPAAALADARRLKCAVIVAKLDSLSRDVHFISGLMAHSVAFSTMWHVFDVDLEAAGRRQDRAEGKSRPRRARASGCRSMRTSLEEGIKLHRFAGIFPEQFATEAGRHREAVVAAD